MTSYAINNWEEAAQLAERYPANFPEILQLTRAAAPHPTGMPLVGIPLLIGSIFIAGAILGVAYGRPGLVGMSIPLAVGSFAVVAGVVCLHGRARKIIWEDSTNNGLSLLNEYLIKGENRANEAVETAEAKRDRLTEDLVQNQRRD